MRLLDKKDRRIPDGILITDLPAPPRGNKLYFDSEIKGFAVRVTAAGARAFVLDYRFGRTQRRVTIGNFPDWSVSAARDEAKTLKKAIDKGDDPMGQRHQERAEPTVGDLCTMYIETHLARKRPSSQKDDLSMIETERVNDFATPPE